ncbi:MAG TPA: alpha/beta fold hydrolase, partial [Flavisolibacter sp.]|nr:alpha/beta fold hydrolase [Flavisolibacter sp.]
CLKTYNCQLKKFMKQPSILAVSLFLSLVISAQKSIDGAWEGKLNTGTFSLRLVVHLKKEATGFSGTMDSPDQGAKDIALSKVELRGDSILMEVASVGGKAVGRLVNDSTFSGQWSQGPASLPLEMKKVARPTTISRPQTPRPPFAYLSEDVIYYNEDKSIQYGATITMPKGAGPFPAMILITGSGQQNRDEELFSHKPFAVIADYLSKRGYAVLRVDDRGVGKTTGKADPATSRDFANDVIVGLEYLKGRKEVDKGKIGMLGHSEGGMIAQIVAAERPDVAFVISLAGPGQPIDELMRDQGRAVMQAAGVSKEAINATSAFTTQVVPAVLSAASDSAAKKVAKEIFTAWAKQTSKEIVEATTGIKEDKDLDQMVDVYRSPWMMYFFRYDPDPFIRRMKAKVLVLNGEKDIQVAAKPNLDGWRASLSNSGVKKFDLFEIKGLNHLFQRCKTCTIQEYAQLEETIAPEALETIGNWLKTNVK